MVDYDKIKRLEELGEKAHKKFETFLKFSSGVEAANHQREWIEHLQFIGDNPDIGHRVTFIAPPGAGKSTVMTAFLAWMIGKYPDKHTGLISYDSKPAIDRAAAVRNVIERSTPFHFTFPGVEPDRQQWAKSHFRVLRKNIADIHPTLRGVGATGAVVSYRMDGLLIDDPMDKKNSANAKMREKVWLNYQDSIYTRLVETAWQVCIGTRWTDDDFIGRLLSSGLVSVENVVHIPAITGSGISYWPEEYPLAPGSKLWEVRESLPNLFYVQYMGDTTGGESAVVKKVISFQDKITIERGVSDSNFPFVKVWVGDDYKHEYRDRKTLLIGIGVDTALKKGRENDYTVAYVGGLDKEGNVWVLDRIKGRWGTPELVEELKILYDKWLPYCIWIEDSAQGTPAVDTIQKEFPFVQTSLVPITQGGSVSRANSITPALHKGQIRFEELNDWFEDTKYQLTHFPNTANDDDIDAVYVLCSELFKIMHPENYSFRPNVKVSMR
jgi:predicted phage terminase large subunit-like protein